MYECTEMFQNEATKQSEAKRFPAGAYRNTPLATSAAKCYHWNNQSDYNLGVV